MTSSSDPRVHKPALPAGAPVLVVGGRGFVGAAIVRALVDDGVDTHVLGPPMASDRLADLRGRFAAIDCGIEDDGAIRRVLARVAPAAIVVCAAHGASDLGLMRAGEADPDRAFAINVDAMRRLFDLAHAHGAGQVVWTSSTTVFGEADGYPVQRVDEHAPKRPGTFYGLTKHLAEEIAAFAACRHRLAIVGLRLPLVLGPGLWYRGAASGFAELFDAARLGRAYEMVAHEGCVDLMHVHDVARAVSVVLRHEGVLSPIYHVNGFTATAADVFDLVCARRPGGGLSFRTVPAARRFLLVDASRFGTDTGFAPSYDLAALVDEAMLKGW